MRKYLPKFFWWGPGLDRGPRSVFLALKYGPRYYWEWCLPQKDHWHIGPIGVYYTRIHLARADARAQAEIALEAEIEAEDDV